MWEGGGGRGGVVCGSLGGTSSHSLYHLILFVMRWMCTALVLPIRCDFYFLSTQYHKCLTPVRHLMTYLLCYFTKREHLAVVEREHLAMVEREHLAMVEREH